MMIRLVPLISHEVERHTFNEVSFLLSFTVVFIYLTFSVVISVTSSVGISNLIAMTLIRAKYVYFVL